MARLPHSHFFKMPQIYKQKTKRAILWAKKMKNLTTIKHSLRNLPSKRTADDYYTHQLSTTHKTLHYLTNSTTKFRKKTSRGTFLQSQIITTTLKKIMPCQPLTQYLINQATARGDSKNSENLMDSDPIIPKFKVLLSHLNMIMVQVYIFSTLSREI